MIDLTKIDCLIGNGNFSQDYSELIDSHSCIARINTLDGLGLDRGNKTDILFLNSCRNKTLKPTVNDFNSTIHVSPKDRKECICDKKLRLDPIPFIKTDRISSGTRIINYLNGKVQKLSLFGFNWRQDPISFYHPYTGYGPHDWEKEKELCLKIINENSWIIYN
jgi:hypothetical protein